MKVRKGVFIGSIMLLAAAGQLRAQTIGPYIALGAGPNFRPDSNLTLRGTGAATPRAMGIGTEGKMGFGTGPAALGSLGWGFGNGLRAELEFSYRSNPVGSVSISGFPGHPALSGSASTSAAMANLLYDINGLGWRLGVPVRPYL